MNRREFRQFIGYIKRVYKFSRIVKSIKDERSWFSISSANVFLCQFFCFVLRWGSIRRIQNELLFGNLKKLLLNEGKSSFSHQAHRNILEKMIVEPIIKGVCWCVKRMKRNKVFLKSIIPGKIIAALDGTETISSFSISCPHCLKRRVRTKEGEKIQFYHKEVKVQIVGCDLKPIIWVEQLDGMKGEGEQTAAIRAVRNVAKYYGKGFVYAYLVDGGECNIPFFREVRRSGSHVVGKLKDNFPQMIQEIDLLTKNDEPIVWQKDGRKIEGWEVEDLQISFGINDLYLRGIKIKEEVRKVEGGKVQYEEEIRYALTTIPRKEVSIKVIRDLLKDEWQVENNGHRDQKMNWHLTHNFHHHPNSIEVLSWINVLAFNMLWAFCKLNLKTYRLYNLTQKEVLERLIVGYLTFKKEKGRGSSIWDTS